MTLSLLSEQEHRTDSAHTAEAEYHTAHTQRSIFTLYPLMRSITLPTLRGETQ